MVPNFEFECETVTTGDTILLGTCYWREGESQTTTPLAEFEDASTVNEVENLLKSTTGFFTIVTSVNSGWIIAADCIASIPIYYTETDGDIFVTDSQPIAETALGNPTFDDVSVAEYRTATYPTGPHTLYKSLFQSEPGTYLHITEDTMTITRWFEFDFHDDQNRNVRDLYNVIRSSISRLIEYADGRQIVVPLSGGHDSRLILTCLIDAGYENVLAISYGVPGNQESEVSEQVAASLGVDWAFCEYTHKKWYDWYRSAHRKAIDDQFCRTGVPSVLEGPAVQTLLEKGTIDSDCVLAPGHTGMVCGGNTPDSLKQFKSATVTDIEDMILDLHHTHNEYTEDEEAALRSRIRDVIQFEGGDVVAALAAYERFDYRERQSKQIISNIRPYEVLDLDWWMPLLDLDFVEFWRRTQVEQRLGKQFYKNAVLEIYTQTADDPVLQTDETPKSLREFVVSRGRKSILKPILRPPYRAYRKLKGAESVYEDPPTARLGALSLEQFKEVYNGDPNLRSYRARALLGEISIDDETSLQNANGWPYKRNTVFSQ